MTWTRFSARTHIAARPGQGAAGEPLLELHKVSSRDRRRVALVRNRRGHGVGIVLRRHSVAARLDNDRGHYRSPLTHASPAAPGLGGLCDTLRALGKRRVVI